MTLLAAKTAAVKLMEAAAWGKGPGVTIPWSQTVKKAESQLLAILAPLN